MAVRYKRKALTFVSSVGVALPLGKAGPISEDTLGTNIAEEFPGSGGYAFGCDALLASPELNTCWSGMMWQAYYAQVGVCSILCSLYGGGRRLSALFRQLTFYLGSLQVWRQQVGN